MMVVHTMLSLRLPDCGEVDLSSFSARLARPAAVCTSAVYWSAVSCQSGVTHRSGIVCVSVETPIARPWHGYK